MEYGLSSFLFKTPSQKDWEEVKNSGYTWIEIIAFPWPGETLAKMKERTAKKAEDMKKGGLRLWTYHIPFGDEWDISALDDVERGKNVERNLEILEQAAELGCRGVVIHPSYEPIPDEKRALRIQHAHESVARIAKRGKELGVFVAIEDLPRSCLGNCSEELMTIIESTGAKICFDVNHLLKESHAHFLEIAGKEIATLHLSDYDGVDERHFVPGDGIIDWKALVRTLKELGYQGPYLFEVAPERLDGRTAGDLIHCLNKAAGIGE